MENFIIIGNGAAGISAAEAIRSKNSGANIEIITEDNILTYYRPLLSSYLGKKIPNNRFYLKENGWYDKNSINITYDKSVVSIDKKNQNVTLSDGTIKNYTKLVIANGSHVFIPPISNVELTGIFLLKSKKDADAIKKAATTSKKVVIIGAGVLGLEVAYELKKLGLDTSVIESANRVLPRQLDKEGSEILESFILDNSIKLFKDQFVTKTLGDKNIKGVALSSGIEIETDMAILCTGVRSNCEIVNGVDIKVNRGIIVNSKMETNDANIYACGDVAELKADLAARLWPIAMEQGKVAGINASGGASIYQCKPRPVMFNGLNTKIFSIGDIGNDPTKLYKNFTAFDEVTRNYKKLYFYNDIFVGGLLIGDISKSTVMMRGLNEKTSEKEILEKI